MLETSSRKLWQRTFLLAIGGSWSYNGINRYAVGGFASNGETGDRRLITCLGFRESVSFGLSDLAHAVDMLLSGVDRASFEILS